jgi:nucleotide-binding universal stress UspA family protein
MKVLMGTDGSVHASGAMLAASRFLKRSDLEVHVLCVSPSGPRIGPLSKTQSAYEERLTRPARRALDDARRILSLAHLRTHGILDIGSPAECLLASAPNYDLTVVGAYGNHERRQPGLGPVSGRLIQISSANIMVGRELCNQDNFRILVAMDSSDASLSALDTLATLFDCSQFDITVMHVIETPWASFYGGQVSEEEPASEDLSEYGCQLERELRKLADNTVNRALSHLEKRGITASTIVDDGDPALQLCSHAEEGGYDLIVCGATGVSDVKHALMGSVSLKLAWNAPCSVLIVRRPVG